jgi:hypothetical protein
VGQRLLESSSKVITRQALEALDAQIRARTSGGGSSPASGGGDAGNPSSLAAPTPPAPSPVKFAAGVVKGVVVDLVPPQHRKKAGLLGIFAAAFALGFGLRSLGRRFTARRQRARDQR